MNDTLNQIQPNDAPDTEPRHPRKRRTLLQQLERSETELRLWWRRKTLLRARRATAANVPAAAVKSAAPQRNAAKPIASKASAAGKPLFASKPASPVSKTSVTAAEVTAPVAATATDSAAPRRRTAEARPVHPPTHAAPAGNPFVWLYETASQKLQRARRRWAHIRREQEAHRFPESNRLPIQLVLLVRGMVPLLGSRLREGTWGRRKQLLHHFGDLRAWLEHKRAHPAGFLGVAGSLAVLALFFSFYTIGTTVSYDGRVVANVASELTAKAACEDLEDLTRSALGGNYTLNASLIQYSNTLMPRKDLVDSEILEEELSENIGLVTYGYSLYVDGVLLGATPYEGALEELLQQLKDGVSGENTISCDFQEDVEIRAEYVTTDKIMNLGYLAELLYSTKDEEITYTVKKGDTWSQIANSHDMTSAQLLQKNPGYNISKLSIGEVLTMSAAVPYLTLTVTERERYVEDVPYEVEYTDSATLYQGDYKVTSPGVYGAADVVANVTYVNGEETERTILSSVTLQNPTTEQQLRGTKERPSWMATGSFRWPCSGSVRSRFGYRTSPGGIGSTNHKGIDIANKKGTPIYAADGGTVKYAGWMSGYGYLVQIDHGNGYVTYYGHNSSLLVHVGQHVYKGQQIAKMGSTGNSTGNHCHFEVRYNGVPKNPMNYLP